MIVDTPVFSWVGILPTKSKMKIPQGINLNRSQDDICFCYLTGDKSKGDQLNMQYTIYIYIYI